MKVAEQMATMRCPCGTVLRDDDPDMDYLAISRRDFDVDADVITLRGRTRDVWRCWTCGRLWVFWEPTGEPTGYLPAADDT